MQQRCPHLAFVALQRIAHFAFGQDAFVTQAGISRPVPVDLELVLGVGRPARRAGLQVATVIPGSGAGFFDTPNTLVLHPADPLVPVVQHPRPFAIQTRHTVGETLLIQRIGQQGCAVDHRLRDALVVGGMGPAKTQLQSVIGRQALVPLAIQAGRGVTAFVVGECGVGDARR